jgi:hypothetical protein
VQSAIFPDNAASLRLHQRAGFRAIGTRERISQRRGHWCDTILIERRSPIVGSADPADSTRSDRADDVELVPVNADEPPSDGGAA